ncbi:MAG: L-seryl-tRNA(Sec) selenium transferase [Anaerolineae bacterium]
MEDKVARLRAIPSVSDLLLLPRVAQLLVQVGHDLVVAAAREATDAARRAALQGVALPEDWGAAVEAALLRLLEPSLLPAINATGVIVHTNLGRAPLSAAALAAVTATAGGYSNLEYDLDEGARGSRYDHAAESLRQLTGAEAALVVNNNAAAVLLVLTALASGREGVISRGQLVEIGGGFRIPDVMRQSGVRLIEVGTTNRTYVSDYSGAVSDATGIVVYVHRSNFYIGGFTHEPALADLAAAAHAAGLPLYADVGSGTLLDTAAFGLAHEPTVQDCLRAGADVVSFSGDKLLGGPQAGVIVGRTELVRRLAAHPLARALRVGKMTLAALEATLQHYLRGEATEMIPVWRMISLAPETIAARAEAWRRSLGVGELRPALSAVGGGSLPGQTLPTTVLAVPCAEPQRCAARLRRQRPPVVARIEEGALVLDPRTVPPERDEDLLAALRRALVDASPATTRGSESEDMHGG